MYKIGVDLGGTNIACGVVDEKYRIIGRGSKKTSKEKTSKEIVFDMFESIRLAVLDAKINMSQIDYCGFGMPGWVDKKCGIAIEATNLCIDNVQLVEIAQNELGVKCGIENDANAAALGEYVAGAGKGSRSFVIITLGTGIGGGIIIDGELFGGINYAAGELGHMVIEQNGVDCPCGRKGCYEKYASVTALILQTKEEMKKNKNSMMWQICNGNIDNVSGKTSFDAMRMGDKAAQRVVDRYIEYVSIGVVDIINIFQPEIICIGGGISMEGNTLIEPIREYVRKYRYTGNTNKQTKIVSAKLGNDAGIIGAAISK